MTQQTTATTSAKDVVLELFASVPTALLGLLTLVWNRMSFSERGRFLRADETLAYFESVGVPKSVISAADAALVKQIETMEAIVKEAGYTIHECEGGFYWETDEEASETIYEQVDCVASAFEDCTKSVE